MGKQGYLSVLLLNDLEVWVVVELRIDVHLLLADILHALDAPSAIEVACDLLVLDGLPLLTTHLNGVQVYVVSEEVFAL